MTRCTIDLDLLRTMTRNKRTPREIAIRLDCCIETVQNWQTKLGLRLRKKRFKDPGGNQYWRAAAVGYDEAERLQWRERNPWPSGIQFTDAKVKPIGYRAPKSEQTQSYVSCGTLLCSEGA
jgi:hypothetical protein